MNVKKRWLVSIAALVFVTLLFFLWKGYKVKTMKHEFMFSEVPKDGYFQKDSFYMFYTAKNQSDSLRIGLAVSTEPNGPFTDIKNEPLFDFGYAVIDANVFLDEDGSKYLYYSRDCSENMEADICKSEIYGVRLSDDLMSIEGGGC